MIKDKWQINCPICKRKLWVVDVRKHHKKKHRDITYQYFEVIIIDAIRSKTIAPRNFGEPSKNLISGTQRINQANQKSRFINTRTLQAGKCSPK